MRLLKILILSAIVLGFGVAEAAVSGGAVGFVQGNIWYSKDPFFAGNPVRVYSGIWNSGADDIIGTVVFYDNGSVIGSSEFQAIGGGRLREVWTDWGALAGTHKITAKITKAFVTRAGAPNEPAQIISGESGESIRQIDSDTDADGVGDTSDTDDDNDGVSDSDELARGTNPLVKDVAQAVTAQNHPVGSQSSSSEPSRTIETANQVVASVTDSIDTTAEKIRQPLEDKKKELEKQITELKIKEAGVTQTTEGAALNQAVGDGTVLATKPTSTPSDTLRRIWLQLYRGAIILALFALDHKIVLYALLAFILYKLIRFVLRRFFTRRD